MQFRLFFVNLASRLEFLSRTSTPGIFGLLKLKQTRSYRHLFEFVAATQKYLLPSGFAQIPHFNLLNCDFLNAMAGLIPV